MRFFVRIIFFSLLTSPQVSLSSEYKYNFLLYSLTFAKLPVTCSENAKKEFCVRFNLLAEGPFKIHRNHSSETIITRDQQNYTSSWLHLFESIYRGQPEKKFIYSSLKESYL